VSRKTTVSFVGTGIVIIAAAISWGPVKRKYFDRPPAVTIPNIVQIEEQTDPLCQVVEGLQLKCLVTPSAEGLMGPGHYVYYPPEVAAYAKVPFSKGDLFDSTCVVPGVQAADLIRDLMAQLKAQEKTNTIKISDITYKLDKTFKSGADLPIPKLPELRIKAGPNLSELQDISLKAPNSWVKVIDENRFINLLTEAAIKQSCVDDLINRKYRVVSASAIATDYEITVTEKSGQSFALSAAIGKGELQMEGGGDANSTLDERIKNASSVPVVVGVDFFDPVLLQENRAKLVAPVFSATGKTNARSRASGKTGQLWQIEQHVPLGQPAPIQRSAGGEGNNCGGGQQSVIQLTTLVAPAAEQSFGSMVYEFTATGTIAGGFFRAPGVQTPFGIQGCQPIPQNVQAEVSFDTTVKTIVRSDAATNLRVELAGIPSGTANVNDWRGQTLPEKPQSEAPAGATRRNFQLSGAGVYEVHVSGSAVVTANGGGNTPVTQRGTFTVAVQ
jgi:hypothetical protein